MPDDEMICGCNGVSKGVIVDAIRNQGCTTVEQIKAAPTRPASCGRCKAGGRRFAVYASELGESAGGAGQGGHVRLHDAVA